MAGQFDFKSHLQEFEGIMTCMELIRMMAKAVTDNPEDFSLSLTALNFVQEKAEVEQAEENIKNSVADNMPPSQRDVNIMNSQQVPPPARPFTTQDQDIDFTQIIALPINQDTIYGILNLIQNDLMKKKIELLGVIDKSVANEKSKMGLIYDHVSKLNAKIRATT